MPETGAAHGRAGGGRIGSGVRLRNKLASAPRMTVLAVVDSSSTAQRKRAPRRSQKLCPALQR
jgi:hypothetical protein